MALDFTNKTTMADQLDELTDDEDFKNFALFVTFPRRRIRVVRQRPDHFEMWGDFEFLERFRLSKNTVRFIVDKLRNVITSPTNWNNAVSAEQKVLLTLRYYATGSLIRATSEFSGIHNSAGSRIIRLVSRRLALLRPEFVGFPEGKKEIAKVRQDFFNIAKVPGCIGSVDGSWVKIQSPGGNDAEVNRSRKGFFALKVMAICDAELKFENIVCRWPGRADDSTIFEHSTIRGKFEANLMGNHLLVGDSGYTPTNYLLTPLREPVTEDERNYNESLIRTHVCIERAFGVWKRRFPVLATGINVEITTVECIVVATVVLHNIARHFGDQIPRVTRDLEDLINLTNVDPTDNDEIPHNYNVNRPLRQTEIINSFSSM